VDCGTPERAKQLKYNRFGFGVLFCCNNATLSWFSFTSAKMQSRCILAGAASFPHKIKPVLAKRYHSMPILSVFFGIIVRMWHDDHPPPHIHVEYQGFEALVNIMTGEVSRGDLPTKARSLVREWCLKHQAELITNWEHGQRFEPMERIAGADQDD
jgi:hypothetical protein